MAEDDKGEPADVPLRFAEKLLALLDGGRFTATYCAGSGQPDGPTRQGPPRSNGESSRR